MHSKTSLSLTKEGKTFYCIFAQIIKKKNLKKLFFMKSTPQLTPTPPPTQGNPILVVCVCLWLFVVVCGCLWLFVVVCGCLWLFVVVCVCLWLFVVVCGCLCLFVIVCGD